MALSESTNDFLANPPGGSFIANPLGIGGKKLTSKLLDPLSLFSSSKKKPFVYDPDKIYGNPENAERARQMTIKLGTDKVNSIFDDPARQGQYDQFLSAIRDFYTADANKQKGVADRNLRFSMARSGLTGGSASVDANRTLGEEYTKGLLDAENKAQGAFEGLKGQDEQSRLNLLSMVRSGMDTTTAASRSGAAMQNNASGAQTEALAGGLGDIFGNTAQVYKTQREAAERRRGITDAYGSVYGAKNPYGN
jgi:hypothetical protein